MLFMVCALFFFGQIMVCALMNLFLRLYNVYYIYTASKFFVFNVNWLTDSQILRDLLRISSTSIASYFVTSENQW